MKNIKKLLQHSLYILLAIVIYGCSHSKKGEIVKDKNGNYYELRKLFPNEGYALDRIDTTKYKVVGFK